MITSDCAWSHFVVEPAEMSEIAKNSEIFPRVAEPFSKWGAQVHVKKSIKNFCGLNRQL